MKLKTIKLIACNIDGVLLPDTFSPVFRDLVMKAGIEYTRELENNTFSHNRKEGREYMMKTYNFTADEIEEHNKIYWEEREKYIKTHDCGVIEGVPQFLEFIFTLDIHLACYGGLSEEKIIENFKKYMHYFERYIDVNDFRPGIKEITKDFYGLEFNEVLFIDDINTVAKEAKNNNVPFIGIPANHPWGFQRQEMIETKVKYLLNSVKDINIELLKKIDYEASIGSIWK